MKIEKMLLYFASVLCLVPLTPWLWTFWAPALSSNASDWANFGTFVGGALSPLLAFASFVGLLLTLNMQRTESDDLSYFNHAVKSLERSYLSLTDASHPGEIKRDRLAWLNCARLLLSAKSVYEKISDKSVGLRVLYDGEEEHWRHQFYELLNAKENAALLQKPSYYGDPVGSEAVLLEERSLRVVFEFSNWPESKADPIEKVPLYSLAELEALKGVHSGFKQFVLSKPRFK